MATIKRRPDFFKGLAAAPYWVLGESRLCPSLGEGLPRLVVTLNLEHPCGSLILSQAEAALGPHGAASGDVPNTRPAGWQQGPEP